MKDTLSTITEYSVPLLLGVLLAVVWANLAPDAYHAFLHAEIAPNVTFDFLVNEVFMVFFFAMACVEITHSLLPGGHLNPLKKAVTPLLATAGGVIGPIVTFFILNHCFGSPDFSKGWAIPTATDIAISWLIAKFVFGALHPAISFLLLLAIADDAIGLIIIAIFYPNPAAPVEPIWLSLSALGFTLALIFNRRFHLQSYWPYLLICGTISWMGLAKAHLHPALALTFIIPLLPHTCERHGRFGITASANLENSALLRFENDFKMFVDFGLFFFGLANAGVEFTNVSILTAIIFFSLFIGKTVGIFFLSKLAHWAGMPLPRGIENKELMLLGMCASIGLTVALFVAGVAYTHPEMVGAAKMGALFSVVVSVIVIPVARLLGVKPLRRFQQKETSA